MKTETTAEPALLTTRAAARLLGLSPVTVYRLLALGKLPARVRVGTGRAMFRRSDLERWIATRPLA